MMLLSARMLVTFVIALVVAVKKIHIKFFMAMLCVCVLYTRFYAGLPFHFCFRFKICFRKLKN